MNGPDRDDGQSLATLRCQTVGMPVTVQIQNALLQPVGAPAIGNLSASLPQGVYVVQFSLGGEIVERPVALTSGSIDAEVNPERRWAIATPIPLPWTADGNGELGQTVRRLSLAVGNAAAQASAQLCVIMVDVDSEGHRWIDSVSLEAMDCIPVELVKSSLTGTVHGASWTGPAGHYQLVSNARNTAYATVMPITLHEGWQTLVFLRPRKYGEACYAADLARAAVAMVPSHEGFPARDSGIARAEAARIALRGPAYAVDTAWIGNQFSNPVLSYFAAHMLLRAPECRVEFLLNHIGRLKAAMGWTPDTVALAWGLRQADTLKVCPVLFWDELEALGPLANPPMLDASCAVLLKAHHVFGSVVAEALIATLSESRGVDSDWSIRKRQDGDRAAARTISTQEDGVAKFKSLMATAPHGGILVSQPGVWNFIKDNVVNKLSEVAQGFLQKEPTGALSLNDLAKLPWDTLLSEVIKSLNSLDNKRLNAVSDQLRPFEREIAEAIFPALNPLNREGVTTPQANRATSDVALALMNKLVAWNERSHSAKSNVAEMQHDLLNALLDITKHVVNSNTPEKEIPVSDRPS
jgi:hypothetical protein